MKASRHVVLSVMLVLSVVVVFVASPTSAKAQGPLPCYGNPFWTHYRHCSSLYTLGRVPVPPYFALHPPVYYSYPVPRPYGYSPYAYPGTMRTPDIVQPLPQPEIIINPHVEPEADETSGRVTDGRTASAALVILNPFVQQPFRQPEGQLAQVIEGNRAAK